MLITDLNKNGDVGSVSETLAVLSSEEEALRSFCKRLLKSRIFRGFYVERRFVNSLDSYRDVISLQRSERELEKLLLNIKQQLDAFYAQRCAPNMWIGITNGHLDGTTLERNALETYLWVEMEELAFGQYWFSIKSVRFRQNEIILKLKYVRAVEEESVLFTPIKQRVQQSDTAPIHSTTESQQSTSAEGAQTTAPPTSTTSAPTAPPEQQINLQDFLDILQQWGVAIKQCSYEFLSQDINRDNIKSVLRFFGLLLISIASGALVGVKFLGIFTLRFMHEFSRLTHVLTPIIFKIIDLLNKVIGGFYILLAMIWRDTVGKRAGAPPPPPERIDFRGVEYNRPLYRAIDYDIRENNRRRFR